MTDKVTSSAVWQSVEVRTGYMKLSRMMMMTGSWEAASYAEVEGLTDLLTSCF